jgi:hypothetical protein
MGTQRPRPLVLDTGGVTSDPRDLRRIDPTLEVVAC